MKRQCEDKGKEREGIVLDVAKIVWNDDAGTVFPAVIVDEFRFLYLNSCVDRNDLCKEYSFTYKVFDYNDYKEYEFRRKNYGKPAFGIITERGGFLVEN